jgi:hypothetical protein
LKKGVKGGDKSCYIGAEEIRMNWFAITLFVLSIVSIIIWSTLKSREEKQENNIWASAAKESVQLDPLTGKPRPETRLYLPIRRNNQSEMFRLGMQTVVSMIVLGGSLYIIMSQHYDPKDKHWAYGSVGTILGFWLKK